MGIVRGGMVVTGARIHRGRLDTVVAPFYQNLLIDDKQSGPCSGSLQYWDTSNHQSNGGPIEVFEGSIHIPGTVTAGSFSK